MGGKKRGAVGPDRSEDKRVRMEAGLDLELGTDMAEVALEHVVKEVMAPKSKKELIDSWVASLCTFLNASPLPKTKPSTLIHPPSPLSDTAKYFGSKVISAIPVGGLASGTLVFPQATGCIQLQLNFNSKHPLATLDEVLTYWNCSLAQLRQRLRSSSLVEPDSVLYHLDMFSILPFLSVRPAGKLSRYLTVRLVLGISGTTEYKDTQLQLHIRSQTTFLTGLHTEVKDLLASFPEYRTLVIALQIWVRQVHFLLPPCMLEILVLHCHTAGVLTSHMKAWQGLRKVWSFLAGSKLDGQDLILGVGDPVPSSVSGQYCPVLDRTGTIPLFPGFPRSQWSLLVMLAGKAMTQGVEQALLTSSRTEAFYDRVLVVTGCNTLPAEHVIASLLRGLGTRVSSLGLVGGVRSWGDEGTGALSMEVGVRLDPAQYWQPTTLGPETADEEACAEFRKFWGDHSQLRRFQDGIVREVVVWSSVKEEVVGDLVRAVLARHHGGCQLEERGGWGEDLLQGDGGTRARAVLDTLIPQLYGLETLPLTVAGVASTGSASRGSRVGTAVVRAAGGKTVRQEAGVCKLTGKGGMAASSLEPLEVVLSAAHSGKWPKEEEAARRVRAAWLGEVGRALRAKVEGLKVRMVGESLVVMYDSTVLRLNVGEKGDKDECELSSWLWGVCKTFPSWTGGVRLFLRWAASHLLSSVSSTALEVTCAAILTSSPHPPTSPTAAFLLFLSTLASHDWNLSPLCVPGCHITKPRSSLPPMAVLTPHSPSPSYWTREVTWPELQRMVSLATDSLNKLSPSPILMFTPNLSCYEALIHLKPLQVPSRHLALAKDTQKKGDVTDLDPKTSVTTIPIVDYDPVSLYVQMLGNCYGNLANFYYDRLGGTIVAVKLRDQSEKVKLHQLSCKMVTEAGVATNWGAVLEDWKILGEGLVKHIEVINTDAML